MNEDEPRDRDAMTIDDATNCPYSERGVAASYALGALDGDEREAFVAHLAGCPVCQAEVASLGAVAAQLPLAADELTPPAALRDRLLAEIAAERQVRPGPPAAGPLAPTPVAVVPRVARVYAVAAVLLLGLALGLLGWNLVLQRQTREAVRERDLARVELAQARAALATWTLAAPGGQPASGQVLYLPRYQQAILVVSGLPPLQPGQVYQVWLIQNGQPEGAGVFLTPSGETAVRADLARYQQVAITIEPGPRGSPQPTSPPVLAGTVGR